MSLNAYLLHSDGVSRALALVLLILSVGSWVVIAWKWRLLSRVGHDLHRSIAAFWQAPAFEEARQRVAQFDRDACLAPLLQATLLPLNGTLASAGGRHPQLTRVLRDALQGVVRLSLIHI
jgi:biopolymer transport protein ExbB